MKTATFLTLALLALSLPVLAQPKPEAKAQAPQAAQAPTVDEARAQHRALARSYDELVAAYKAFLSAKGPDAKKAGARFQAEFRSVVGMKNAVWMGEGRSLLGEADKRGPEAVSAELSRAIGIGPGGPIADANAPHSAMEAFEKPAHREMLRFEMNALNMAADLKKLAEARAKPQDQAKLKAEYQAKTARMQEQSANWRRIAEGTARRGDVGSRELDAAFDARTNAAGIQAQAGEGQRVVSKSAIYRAENGDLVYTRDYYTIEKDIADNDEKRAELMRSGKLPPAITAQQVLRVKAEDSKDFWEGVEAMKKQLAERKVTGAGQLEAAPYAVAAAKDGAANGDRAAQAQGAALGAVYLAMDPSTLDKRIDKAKSAEADAADKIQDLLSDRADRGKDLLKQKKKDREKLEEESLTGKDAAAREAAAKRMAGLDEEYRQKSLALDAQLEKDSKANKDYIEKLRRERAAMEEAKKANEAALAAQAAAAKKQEEETQEQERRKSFRESYISNRDDLRRYFWPHGDQVDRFYLSEAKDPAKLENAYIASGKKPYDFMMAAFKEWRPKDEARMKQLDGQLEKDVFNR